MIECRTCLELKSESSFDLRPDTNKLRTSCKPCRAKTQRERYEKFKLNSFFKYKAARAKTRATSRGLPFNITAEYLESIWTDTCPVSGIVFNRFADRSDEAAPELDRMVPDDGYVIGNVAFISRKINRLKNNATVEELERLLEWMKKNQ